MDIIDYDILKKYKKIDRVMTQRREEELILMQIAPHPLPLRPPSTLPHFQFEYLQCI